MKSIVIVKTVSLHLMLLSKTFCSAFGIQMFGFGSLDAFDEPATIKSDSVHCSSGLLSIWSITIRSIFLYQLNYPHDDDA